MVVYHADEPLLKFLCGKMVVYAGTTSVSLIRLNEVSEFVEEQLADKAAKEEKRRQMLQKSLQKKAEDVMGKTRRRVKRKSRDETSVASALSPSAMGADHGYYSPSSFTTSNMSSYASTTSSSASTSSPGGMLSARDGEALGSLLALLQEGQEEELEEVEEDWEKRQKREEEDVNNNGAYALVQSKTSAFRMPGNDDEF